MKDTRIVSSIILAVGLLGAAAMLAMSSLGRTDRYELVQEKQVPHGNIHLKLFDRQTGTVYTQASRSSGGSRWKVDTLAPGEGG